MPRLTPSRQAIATTTTTAQQAAAQTAAAALSISRREVKTAAPAVGEESGLQAIEISDADAVGATAAADAVAKEEEEKKAAVEPAVTSRPIASHPCAHSKA